MMISSITRVSVVYVYDEGQSLHQTHLAAPAFTANKVVDLLDLDLVLAQAPGSS